GGARGGPPADAAAGDRAWDGAWTPGAGPGPGAVPAAVRPGAAAGAGRAPARTGRPDRLGGPATGSPAHEAPRAAWLRRSAWVAGVGHSVTHRGHVLCLMDIAKNRTEATSRPAAAPAAGSGGSAPAPAATAAGNRKAIYVDSPS